MKGKRLLCPGILLFLASMMVILSWQGDCLYGSSCDWFSQHVSIAETMRQTILEEKTLFPGQLPLGGGNNIYDFSYYGYLRPDVLLACLIPQISMEWVIMGYTIAGYLVSAVLFYVFLKKNGCSDLISLPGGILFLSAGCFFQIHRQIMFINYMPFLLGALLCIRECHQKRKRALLIMMMLLIELHSYYYAISCLLVLYLYFLYTAQWERPGIIKKLWMLTLRYAGWAFVSVAMAGVLLLPTAAAILENAMGKDGGSAGKAPLEFHWNFESLLYGSYGIGLTLLALLLLLLSLCRKKSRLLGGFLVFCMTCGLVPLVLNGFLYNRAKILMPLLPLILLLAMETLQEYWKKRRRPPFWCLLAALAVSWMQYRLYEEAYALADGLLVLLFFLALWQNSCDVLRQNSRRVLPQNDRVWPGNGWKDAALVFSLGVICAAAFAFGVALHRGDEWMEKGRASISSFSKEERQEFYQNKEYRFDSLNAPYQTANCLLGFGAGRTSMYTSISNGQYSDFFYDEICNPIGNNNRVGLYNRANPFFLYLMGVRYLEATKEKLPDGYQIVKEKGDVVLAERKDVLPLCYGSCDLLEEKEYEALDFPDRLEALASKSIVPSEGDEKDPEEEKKAGENASRPFASHFTRLYPQEGIDYEIERISEAEFTVHLKERMEGQILVIQFEIKRTSREAAVITINGITNKISGASAPYPNHNDCFTYLLSSVEAIEELHVKTSGSYEAEEPKIYSIPVSWIGNREVYPMEEGKVSGKKESLFRPKEKVKGTLAMPRDGYLVTSFPIQKGYQVFVDGEPCPVETVNRAFVGAKLLAGIHEISITYEPPLEKAGMLLSVSGWLVFGMMAILEIRSYRKDRGGMGEKP